MTKEEIIHFLDWMHKVSMDNPMMLETDNEDIAGMYLLENPQTEEREVIIGLLQSAVCPDCDGSGVKILETTRTGTKWVDDGHGNPLAEPVPEVYCEQEQCEWCFHKHTILNT